MSEIEERLDGLEGSVYRWRLIGIALIVCVLGLILTVAIVAAGRAKSGATPHTIRAHALELVNNQDEVILRAGANQAKGAGFVEVNDGSGRRGFLLHDGLHFRMAEDQPAWFNVGPGGLLLQDLDGTITGIKGGSIGLVGPGEVRALLLSLDGIVAQSAQGSFAYEPKLLTAETSRSSFTP